MTVLAVALLAGSVAAFTYTEKLKLERSPVGVARFDRWLSPTCACSGETARLSFRLLEEEHLDVTIVDLDRNTVRTLARNLAATPGRLAFVWDGRDDEGAVVADGAYRVQVRLREARRTTVIPVNVNVDTVPPLVVLHRLSPTRLAPGEEIEFVYDANEFGRPVVLVDGEIAQRGGFRQSGTTRFVWNGELRSSPLPPGGYVVALQVEDRAGNLSEPSRSTIVVVTASP